MINKKSQKGGGRFVVATAGFTSSNEGRILEAEDKKKARLINELKFQTDIKYRPDFTLEELEEIIKNRDVKRIKIYRFLIAAKEDQKSEIVGRFKIVNMNHVSEELSNKKWSETFMNFNYTIEGGHIGDFDIVEFMKFQLNEMPKQHEGLIFQDKIHVNTAMKFINNLGVKKIKEINKKIGLLEDINIKDIIGIEGDFKYKLYISSNHMQVMHLGGKKTKKNNTKKNKAKKNNTKKNKAKKNKTKKNKKN